MKQHKMQSFTDGRAKKLSTSFELLPAADQSEYLSMRRVLDTARKCCLCGQYYRLRHTAGLSRQGHSRDHIDYETEARAHWEKMTIRSDFFALFQEEGYLSHLPRCDSNAEYCIERVAAS